MSAQKIRAAIIGGSESGKTFRAIGYSRGFWARQRLRSLVFDPWKGENKWGPQAWVCHDFEQWRRVVCNVTGCVVIWDEASGNGGRDRENVQLFTEIRHRHPALFCIAHAYSAILPIMRVNLTDLFIAQADAGDAAEWAKIMKDPSVNQAVTLHQYEFLHKRAFQTVKVCRETKSQIEAGILP
jgi:hypothetical protein